MKTISQKRALHWLGRIDTPPAGLSWKQASSFLNGLPLEIRGSGLGLALATHLPDLTKPAHVHKAFLIESLVDWLVTKAGESGSPYTLQFKDNADLPAKVKALLTAISNGHALAYMRATEEALAWIEWGKPLVKAQIPPETQPPAENQASQEAGQ